MPPAGSRIIITNIEGSNTTTNRFRVGVFSETQITANLVTGVYIAHNPPGVFQGARAGTRADVGLVGYVYGPGIREQMPLRTVVDSIAGQRFFAIAQTANEPSEFAVKGYITASELDTDARLIL